MSWPVPSRITPYAVRAAKIHITIYPLPIGSCDLVHSPSWKGLLPYTWRWNGIASSPIICRRVPRLRISILTGACRREIQEI